MDKPQVTLTEVAAAFERLVAHVLASACDTEYAQTIHFAGIDVLDILRGEWERPTVGEISAWPTARQESSDEGRFVADDQRPF